MSDKQGNGLNPPPMGSRSGTTTGYTVEARYNYPSPKQFGDMILDKEWRRLNFSRSPIGVPATGPRFIGGLEREATGLLSYAAAEALRWWFIAELDDNNASSICLETRIVAHTIRYSFSVEAIEAQSMIDCPAFGTKIKGAEPSDAAIPASNKEQA